MDTPLGKQRAVLELSTRDGSLHGAVRDLRHGEEVVVTDLVRDGDRLTWAQSVTRPLRLNLVFDVVVDGDELTGRARAGRLPASAVTGRREDPNRVADGL
ncbi:hypothetical protein [Umezawaea beigongshangensis]|uniref:hypothetical protein n=1 Tax=Umezawaea beigongshangensis TaxID=2780383 RepID=UPI0027DB181A|nr:hypothetical protein [Umezawaea beigongshangensis]